MGYYPNTIKVFREIIKKKYPRAKPKEGISGSKSPSHLLWMLEEIEKMKDGSGKAGRWLGYVICAMEVKKLLTNQESRDIIRKDVSEGYE